MTDPWPWIMLAFSAGLVVAGLVWWATDVWAYRTMRDRIEEQMAMLRAEVMLRAQHPVRSSSQRHDDRYSGGIG